MSIRFILIVLFCLGCSTQKAQRNVASNSAPILPTEVDPEKSIVRIFPAVADEHGLWYYFYLQLKDRNGQFVDSDDIKITTLKGEGIPFLKERIKSGRYYLTLEKNAGVSSAHLNVLAQGKILKEEFKLSFDYPHKSHSKIRLVQKENHVLKFQLNLRDEKNIPVAVSEQPEIFLEGMGIIKELNEVSQGTWEFTVVYPDENQIMYLSVRAMGVFLPKLFRYQHVEK